MSGQYCPLRSSSKNAQPLSVRIYRGDGRHQQYLARVTNSYRCHSARSPLPSGD